MRNLWNILAFMALGLVFAGMSLYLFLHPDRTGVVPAYRYAAFHWFAGESMYSGGTHGFLYAPAFAVLFTPFNLIQPVLFGEILWRLLGFGLFGWALWRLSAVLRAPTFMYIVLLAVPAALASLNNGQTNLFLSAILILSVLALRNEQWNLTALLLSVGLILKPIALAPWLLAFVVFPSTRRPLFLGLLGTIVAGFLHPDMNFAWSQNLGFLHKLANSYAPENLRVSDLFGAFEKCGISIPSLMEKGLRGAACLSALGFVWSKAKRGGEPGGSWGIWVASALVFTIFNPRAETNSYVLISPLLAFVAVCSWREGEGGRWRGIVLTVACIALMCDGMGKTIYLATDVWLKPLIVLVVSPLLFRMPDSWKTGGR
ncbi:MAG: DUF2029 domain-containing protein [Verrucomicrobia bacterium]|nr:DUF2029 domain-containing protein [Verrucomicrobiota bacterium]